MWDYSFIAPSVLVMITLLVMYLTNLRLRIRFNKIFLELLAVESCVIVLDIVSTRMDEFYHLFNTPTLYLINMMFFIAFLTRIFWFTRFTWALLNLSPREHRGLAFLKFAPLAIAILICLSSVYTGAVFSIADGQYVSGPWYNLLAFTYLYYISFSVLMLSRYVKIMRQRDYSCALGYNLALFLGTAVRILLPRLLVMDSFCVIAILVIYLSFANPDLYLYDNRLLFSMHGFSTLMAEPEMQRSYYLLGFSLRNYAHERSIVGRAAMRETIDLVSTFLTENFEGTSAFYLRGGRFVLVGKPDADWEAMRARIVERFHSPWVSDMGSLRLDVSFVQVDSHTTSEPASAIVSNFKIALDDARQGTLSYPEKSDANAINVGVIEHRIEVLRALEYALQHDMVEVYLQPIFKRDMKTLVGAEALARIWDASGNIVSPALFIPIAEKSGYIHELGCQVLRKTCAFVRDNDLDALGLEWINVNLSPLQCLQDGLTEQFVKILEEYQVPIELIRLELTEESMVDYSLLERQVSELRSQGFQFVLDDYGAGYSNLTRVRRYPFITIKLDIELVWDYFKDRNSLLPVLVQGFKQLGLSVTAEGVETADMASLLSEIGCDYLQGYYFSKPVPPTEFLRRYRVEAGR